MPTNVTLGSTVQFTAAFFNASQVLVTPSAATITITYPLSSNSVATGNAVLAMVPSGSFFTTTWGTGVAALGITSYSVLAIGQSTPITGTLRLTT